MNTIHLDLATVAFVVGTVIPLLCALLTKSAASPGVKAVVTLLLSAVAGVLQRIIEVGLEDILLKPTLTAIVITWITAIASYYGLWKPTTAAARVASISPDAGIGTAIDAASTPKRE